MTRWPCAAFVRSYIDDAVAAIVAALDAPRPGGFAVYNVGGGAAVSLLDLISAAEEAAGTTARGLTVHSSPTVLLLACRCRVVAWPSLLLSLATRPCVLCLCGRR